MQTKEETKAYMRNYYIRNKVVFRQKYLDWCAANPNKNRGKRGKEKKTPEELKAYRRQYYLDHKAVYQRKYREWCKANPEMVAVSNQRWRNKNPHYYRDYMRRRITVSDRLIFQFLDGGVEGDIKGYVSYLQEQGVPEQHIGWFKTDLETCLSGKTERRRQ